MVVVFAKQIKVTVMMSFGGLLAGSIQVFKLERIFHTFLFVCKKEWKCCTIRSNVEDREKSIEHLFLRSCGDQQNNTYTNVFLTLFCPESQTSAGTNGWRADRSW